MAMCLCRVVSVDLVVMDWRMPVMDGIEAAQAIRALADPIISSVPIVMCSAHAFEKDR